MQSINKAMKVFILVTLFFVVYDLNHAELKHVLSEMMIQLYGNHWIYAEPPWWAEDLPWCSPRNVTGLQLRDTISAGYTFYGQESKLRSGQAAGTHKVKLTNAKNPLKLPECWIETIQSSSSKEIKPIKK